jgi:hypothetical protein
MASRQQIATLLLLAGAVLLVLGFVLPWIIVRPLNEAAVVQIGTTEVIRGPLSLLTVLSGTFITSGAICFPLVQVVSIIVLCIGTSGMLFRGRSPIPLDLMVAACALGLLFTPIMLVLLGPIGFSRQVPRFAITYSAGLWLTIGGYLVALLGCFVLRRRRRPSSR